ncbi:DUF3368 domain-containing protein [Halobaculum sp. WSA2]|uniref:DUF3368 domain-containing protein n=1 Tax=Halobaculum saliterrae TaxID=2073113 RepID=A0A6B0SV84_9EURY|nr:DUF3368 domain-containing protein [Halobaculum saliterrae]MXR40523.1 DUF3368 domain-containing protein [Halobaculum saliterrae]
MPTEQVVVADTSPLLNLALIDQLELLETQFPSLLVPEQVWDELTAGEAGTESLRTARKGDLFTLVSVEQTPLFTELANELDRGETAAICHAVETDADLVLIDEADGREVARRHELSVTGAIGILLRAAKNGAIDLETELDALQEAGFWISSDLREQALAAVEGE